MHPLVRNLYKRVLHVGHDYPTGMEHVRATWKKAIRNPQNCPACYDKETGEVKLGDPACQEEMLFAVNKGRWMVKEMIGVIKLKKYRAMKKRYGSGSDPTIQKAMDELEEKHLH